VALLAFTSSLHASDYHVATNGSDTNSGAKNAPFRTIQHAADLAQPGDVITVHAGVYRERVNPPRGGTSDANRITYQAAPGEKVTITGSEPMKGWEKVSRDTWKVIIPNKYFGSFNPYADRIHGDWFAPQGRQHHTGCVYLNGEWFIEAASHLNEVLSPAGKTPRWFAKVDNAEDNDYLLNLAGFTVGEKRIAATAFDGKNGELHPAACSEGGQCIGWIRTGSWLKFDKVNFGAGTESILFRTASVTGGGSIEIHADKADGELLGTCKVADTGDWGKWQTFTANIKPTSGEKNICLVFNGPTSATDNTTIWAQFPGVNPNNSNVEINVRKTVFTPEKTGINYITVRGFTLRNAATNWAPPTAGQIGLITAYWCKGWIIEDNEIAYSTCSGVALGKYSDEFDNKSANSAKGYVETVKRAQAHTLPWTMEHIGHHIVRNNHISHCEQTGIVGSLGCSFSTVTGNHIHDIHVRQLFTGAEMAGIKFHGAIDTTISHNHIYRTNRGLWLDWMAQGARVSGNLMHDNDTDQDLYLEVNHGPFVIDNNVFLSRWNIWTMSEGGAFAHNLFAGKIVTQPELGRETPFHLAHSTAVAGLKNIAGGDDRFYNNIFVGNGTPGAESTKAAPQHSPRGAGYGLWVYNQRETPLQAGGNVCYHGAQPYSTEAKSLVLITNNPSVKLEQKDGQFLLQCHWGAELKQAGTVLVTTALLGRAKIPNLPYENPDGSPLRIDNDYFGKPRQSQNPTPGPFENAGEAILELKVWDSKEK